VKNKHLHKIFANVKSFPSIPFVASKIFGMLDDEDVSAEEIEKEVKYDAGLTANILKMANSAYFGFPAKVGSLKQAVVLMGANRVKQLLLASCMNAIMDKEIEGYDLPSGELWRHSIAVSVTAEEMVKELKFNDSEDVFTAALLHDIGKLALGRFVKDEIKEIEEESLKSKSFVEAERVVLGTDHAEVGALILKEWAFPDDIINTVRWHHAPDESENSSRMLDIVHVANVLCLMIGIGSGREGLRYEVTQSALERLGLKLGHLESIASRTLHSIESLFIE